MICRSTSQKNPPDLVSSNVDVELDFSGQKSNGLSFDRFKQQLFDSFSQFSRETSLHGLKRITSTIPTWQKTVWILMIVGMCVTLIFQLKNKFDSYWETPVSLYMNVRYETAVPFPAVVLCNANLFRISETTQEQWYKLFHVINNVYSDTTFGDSRRKEVSSEELSKIDGHEFLKAVAHQKESLILSCQWPNGVPCSHENFRPIITDYGVCYAINDGSSGHSEVVNISNSGSGYGLYLVLNAEDYEAMSGPQKTVGIKVLIHKQGEIPLIAEQAFDVAPGFQTSVGLKHREIDKLEKSKGGDCGIGELHLFKDDPYSTKICTVDRKYHAAVNACNCLPYMFHTGVLNKTICDAGQFFGCMINASQSIKLTISKDDCPQDCQSFEYQQYVSFSELSTSHINNVLTFKQRENIKRQYLISREARSRNTESEANNDDKLVQNLLLAYNQIENSSLIPGTSWSGIVNGKVLNLTCYDEHVLPLTEIDDFCNVDAIEIVLSKNLERLLLFHLMENIQRVIRDVNNSVSSFTMLVNDIDRFFHLYAVQKKESPSEELEKIVAQHLFVENSKNVLKVSNQTIEASMKDVALTLRTLETYWSEIENISSLRQFNQSEKLLPSLTNALKCLNELLKDFPHLVDVASTKMLNVKNKLGESVEAAENCVKQLESFNKLFSTYNQLAVVYKANHTIFVEHIRTACKKFNRIRQVSDSSQNAKPTKIDEYLHIKEILLLFANGTITKANTSNSLLETSQPLYLLQAIRTYFEDVKRYATSLQNDLFKEAQLSFVSLAQLYGQTRYTDILFALYPATKDKGNVSEMLINANVCIPVINEVLEEISTKADENAEQYLKAFSDFKDECQKYNNSLQIDMQFYKSNLLALNIYFREMSTEVLAQRLSYDSWSLLSDIGGTLGLFLGASLLTMGEILEYLVNQCLFIMRYRTKKKLESQRCSRSGSRIQQQYYGSDAHRQHSEWLMNRQENTQHFDNFDVTIMPKKQTHYMRSGSIGSRYTAGKLEYYL